MIPRERLIDTARRVYRSYGFSPIDTPALEYLEILAGKGSEETDKQLYKFQDHGGRWVGLRFDLTVPLARFAAQHVNELGTPLKRYHIATVWRGENTQRGRYREFMQCDFDTIGTRSVAADIETALVIHDLLRAIGFAEFTIRLNNRMVLTGLLERLGLADRATAVLRALDKLGKIGPERRGRGDDRDGRRHRRAGPADLAAFGNLRRQRRGAAAGRAAGGRQRNGPGRRGQAQGSARRRGGGRRARPSACGSTCRSPAGWTTTPARSSRRFWTPCRASAASAPAAATTTWPSCSHRRNCPASGPRWGWIGCWRRWKSWA